MQPNPYDVERQMYHELRTNPGYTLWPRQTEVDLYSFARIMIALACIVGLVLPMVFRA